MKSDDEMAACLACLLLGEGKYTLKPADEATPDPKMPFLMFGGEKELNAWLAPKGYADLGAAMDAHQPKVREAMESVLIGGAAERATFEDMLAAVPSEKRADIIAKRHDRKRSSLNDIGSRARAWASRLSETESA